MVVAPWKLKISGVMRNTGERGRIILRRNPLCGRRMESAAVLLHKFKNGIRTAVCFVDTIMLRSVCPLCRRCRFAASKLF